MTALPSWLRPLLQPGEEGDVRAPIPKGSPAASELAEARELARSARWLGDLPGQQLAARELARQATRRFLRLLLNTWGISPEDDLPSALRTHAHGEHLLAELGSTGETLLARVWSGDGHSLRYDEGLERLLDVLERHAKPLSWSARRRQSVRLLRWLSVPAGLAVVGSVGWSTLGPDNMALYRPVALSSVYKLRQYPPQGLTDGVDDRLGCHTRKDASPWARIDLSKERKVSRVVVYNRDGELAERAVPLLVEVSTDGEHFREVARQVTPFEIWAAEIEPVRTRYVRVRVDRESYLHLNEVEVF